MLEAELETGVWGQRDMTLIGEGCPLREIPVSLRRLNGYDQVSNPQTTTS